MIAIFDRYVNIKNRKEMTDCTEEMIEKLDQMLTENEIPHSFFYTTAEEQDQISEKGQEYIASVMYKTEKEMEFELVYCLWAKRFRNTPDELIRKAWKKNIQRNTTKSFQVGG